MHPEFNAKALGLSPVIAAFDLAGHGDLAGLGQRNAAPVALSASGPAAPKP